MLDGLKVLYAAEFDPIRSVVDIFQEGVPITSVTVDNVDNVNYLNYILVGLSTDNVINNILLPGKWIYDFNKNNLNTSQYRPEYSLYSQYFPGLENAIDRFNKLH